MLGHELYIRQTLEYFQAVFQSGYTNLHSHQQWSVLILCKIEFYITYLIFLKTGNVL